MSLAVLALILFASIFLLVLYGYPVAFTLGGLSLLYAFCFLDASVLTLLPNRVMGTMENAVLLAVPLFIFMGIMLEKSGLAERMLHSMSRLFGPVRGGMAVSVVVVGALLAASTGIVGATVITMGLISLPPMLRRGYPPTVATGVIAASGTLGQIIPPSVVLVLLGSVLGVSVGKLFRAALYPSLLLVGAYVAYLLLLGWLRPGWLPAGEEGSTARRGPGDPTFWREIIGSLFLPLLLIVAVLGSILAGIASPTEAAAVGAAGAIGLTAQQRRLSWATLADVCRDTTHLTSMVFMILLGATTFSLVFRELGGDGFLVSLKFSLAKLWYVGAYFLVPLMILRRPGKVAILVHCILWPLLFVAVQTLIRHGMYGFSFAMQSKTMSPFMSEHVSYAGCLAVFTPWLFWLRWYRKQHGRSTWWWGVLLLPVWLAAVYFSYTRAAFVALALAGGAYYLIKWRLLKPVLALAVVAVVVVAGYFLRDNRYLDYAPNYETTITQERFDNLIAATYKLEDISTMERFYRWVAAGHMVPYRPWTGWGPGNFVEFYEGYTVNAFETYVSDNPGRSGIHSYYLMTLVEQGYPGLLIFLVYVFGALIIGERLYHRQTDPAARNAIMAALLALLIVDAFNIINDQMETDKVGAQYLLNLAVLVMMGVYRGETNTPEEPS